MDDVLMVDYTGDTAGANKYNYMYMPNNWSNPANPEEVQFDEVEFYTDIGDEYPNSLLIEGRLGEDIVAPAAPVLFASQ